MDEYAVQLLKIQAVGSLRQDETVARQHVMNHGLACHFMDLSFIRDAVEMSIPESYAVQGLSSSQRPREAAGINLANKTPSS